MTIAFLTISVLFLSLLGVLTYMSYDIVKALILSIREGHDLFDALSQMGGCLILWVVFFWLAYMFHKATIVSDFIIYNFK